MTRYESRSGSVTFRAWAEMGSATSRNAPGRRHNVRLSAPGRSMIVAGGLSETAARRVAETLTEFLNGPAPQPQSCPVSPGPSSGRAGVARRATARRRAASKRTGTVTRADTDPGLTDFEIDRAMRTTNNDDAIVTLHPSHIPIRRLTTSTPARPQTAPMSPSPAPVPRHRRGRDAPRRARRMSPNVQMSELRPPL